ncbi:UNKNOWN [Stylonychia lemnae]|uniref:Uncharacterized protein n=1 Tax=Stylonychia lemnae TaxID=5949 RepID=A0A078AEN9_STYLE|nr:UNKNOWN [Stylonychia lemnae]|eukprot:CDW80306.1 UNKNOWN [Stylonychia lemnae]
MKKNQSPTQIVEEIKSQFKVISKAGKASEQMYVNLQKKDYSNDLRYIKPDTPQKYQEVKKITTDQIKKIKDLKLSLKENKDMMDPRKAIPTLNEFSSPPKLQIIELKQNLQLQLDQERLEEQDQSRYDFQNSKLIMPPLTQRFSSQKDLMMNNNTGSNSSRMDNYHNDGDDTIRDDIQLFKTSLVHQQTSNSNLLDQSQQQQYIPNRRQLEKSSSLPTLNQSKVQQIDRSQIEPYLMNLKFSRQTKRKGIDTKDVNENRFENINKFPETLSQNKKIIWNLKFDKQKQRDEDWIRKKDSFGQQYDLVDVEKFKFKKTYIAKIAGDQTGNNNHHNHGGNLSSRYYY